MYIENVNEQKKKDNFCKKKKENIIPPLINFISRHTIFTELAIVLPCTVTLKAW